MIGIAFTRDLNCEQMAISKVAWNVKKFSMLHGQADELRYQPITSIAKLVEN